jgi:Zn-dependent peptidase ImmA (M78 family)
MSDYVTMMIRRFKLARVVNHYYFMHTSGDDDRGLSVDNIENIVHRVTGLPIETILVRKASTIIRSKYVRWSDGALIMISAGQEPYWERFCRVKELCHILCDRPEEFQPSVNAALRDLLEPSHTIWSMIKNGSASSQVEKLAEIIAVELVYPIEFRRDDRKLLDNGSTTIMEIAENRGVPPVHVQHGTDPALLKAMTELWETINSEGDRIEPLPGTP